MKNYDSYKLTELGYTIENALIEKVDLSMADHGCLTLAMTLQGGGWGVTYGGYCLGKGYLGADDDYFDGSAAKCVVINLFKLPIQIIAALNVKPAPFGLDFATTAFRRH